MQVPPKQRIQITPFDLKTQREAFTVSLEGLKGVCHLSLLSVPLLLHHFPCRVFFHAYSSNPVFSGIPTRWYSKPPRPGRTENDKFVIPSLISNMFLTIITEGGETPAEIAGTGGTFGRSHSSTTHSSAITHNRDDVFLQPHARHLCLTKC